MIGSATQNAGGRTQSNTAAIADAITGVQARYRSSDVRLPIPNSASAAVSHSSNRCREIARRYELRKDRIQRNERIVNQKNQNQ